MPAGASSAVLDHVAISGDRVVVLGQEVTPAGAVPFAELSADGGASWRQVPFRSPALGTVITTLTSGSGGFTASGQSGPPGQQAVVTWTSATGTTWAMIKKIGIPPGRSG